MFLRMITIGIVVILFGVLGTLGFVNTKKAADLNKEVIKVRKELKDTDKEIAKLREEFEAFEKKSHASAHGGKVHWGYEGDMRLLPLDLAKRIYREDYWNVCRCDELPWPMALFLFDHAVNSGPVTAIRTAQRSLKVPADGVMGPVTVRAIQRADREQQALYMADRGLFYTRLENFRAFGRGWFKRLFLMAMG